MNNPVLKYASVFIGIPLLLWSLGDYHRDDILKEALSVLTLLAFSLMIGQFYLTRFFREDYSGVRMSKLVKMHRAFGYVFVSVLFLHPLFVVMPRYFEAGLNVEEAFVTMVTTFDSLGIVLGIIAWCLIVVLGLFSVFKEQSGLSYINWRTIHGILSILFISIACYHVIDMGRHINFPIKIFMVFFSAGGILIVLRNYIFQPKKGTLSR